MDLTFWMNQMWLDIDLERNIHTVFIQSAAKMGHLNVTTFTK